MYKARVEKRQAKQVNAIRVRTQKTESTENNNSNDSIESDENDDMVEYLRELEHCKYNSDTKMDDNSFKLRTPILVENQKLMAEVDTGSEITLLNKTTFIKLVPLRDSADFHYIYSR